MDNIESQFEAYLLGKVKDLAAQLPGYTTIDILARSFGADPLKIKYRAYNQHIGHTEDCKTMDEAIGSLVVMHGGRSRSEILRDKAAALLEEANTLEGKESQPA